ncbi:MAG TPA: crotonase/enoyl-CoA hydratase family protein [Acidimicrobiia bacterium]|nr:crotonase/enoyl-CoA hydratase family protein [Acidimicrobiia bacterium]
MRETDRLNVSERVRYQRDDDVAIITMDDGKVNALSNDMFAALNDAFDRADADGLIVVLAGREGILSAGFDLRTLQAGGVDAVEMLKSGFELAYRMLSFPSPVIVACTGHAMAMGVFLVLSGDYRIGPADPDVKVVANEVAIGLTMPRAAVEICRQRLHPAHLPRAVNLAEQYTPEEAVGAGFLDRVVSPTEVVATAVETAHSMTLLNRAAHTGTKLRLREHTLAALRAAIDADDAELRALL